MDDDVTIVIPDHGYQWINWFPRWQGFGFKRSLQYSAWACIYDWYLWFGWFEIRRWANGKRIYRPPVFDGPEPPQ